MAGYDVRRFSISSRRGYSRSARKQRRRSDAQEALSGSRWRKDRLLTVTFAASESVVVHPRRQSTSRQLRVAFQRSRIPTAAASIDFCPINGCNSTPRASLEGGDLYGLVRVTLASFSATYLLQALFSPFRYVAMLYLYRSCRNYLAVGTAIGVPPSHLVAKSAASAVAHASTLISVRPVMYVDLIDPSFCGTPASLSPPEYSSTALVLTQRVENGPSMP